MITQDELKKLLHYDPNTGEFTWLVNRGKKKAGSVAGCRCKSGYIQIKFADKVYLGHRLAWLYHHGQWPTNQVDHINGQRDDNRISNLRDVTIQQNQFNQKKVRGYSWHSVASKWRARITFNQTDIHLGLYDTEAEARQAYLDAKAKYHII